MEEKKGIGALILALGKPKKSSESDEDESPVSSGDHDESESAVMSEFLDAVESKDVSGALEAFKSLLEICEPGYSEEK